MPDGAAANERLSHLMHLDRGHHARWHSHVFQRVLKRQSIDDSCEHPHVIAGYAVHLVRARCDAPKNVSAPQHETDLNARASDLRDLGCKSFDALGIKSKG